MTALEGLNIINNYTAQLRLTRQEHIQIQIAMDAIREAIYPTQQETKPVEAQANKAEKPIDTAEKAMS